MTSPLIRLRPSHVLYSRESISQETIVETFRQLVDGGGSTVDGVRPLTVFRYRHKYWTCSGNRLLYVYRKLEELGVIDTIAVNVLARPPFETGNDDDVSWFG